MADYIDRAEAIKALREFGETCKDSAEAATAVSVAISVLSRVPSPWADANTRKPKKTGEYLCTFKYRHSPWDDVFMDKMTYCKTGKNNGFDPWGGKIVSHWMELPDAPDAPEVPT